MTTPHFQVQVSVQSKMPDLPTPHPVIEASISVPTFTLSVQAETEFEAEMAGGNYVTTHFGGLYTVIRSRATRFTTLDEKDLIRRQQNGYHEDDESKWDD